MCKSRNCASLATGVRCLENSLRRGPLAEVGRSRRCRLRHTSQFTIALYRNRMPYHDSPLRTVACDIIRSTISALRRSVRDCLAILLPVRQLYWLFMIRSTARSAAIFRFLARIVGTVCVAPAIPAAGSGESSIRRINDWLH